jgi:hypothetical protein
MRGIRVIVAKLLIISVGLRSQRAGMVFLAGIEIPKQLTNTI